MAKYSFHDLTNVLGGKKKLAVIAGITSVSFLFGGCISSVARLARKSTAAVAATTEATEDPQAVLYGTYYGYNGSVLILKDDGNADYFYSGQNDVKHSNTWSLEDDEITINMSWLFCTVKGTVESDPTSFVLVGNSDLDDILWDDERFEQVSTDTAAMTKAECEAFIADMQSGGLSVSESGDTTDGIPPATDLNIKQIQFNGITIPVMSNYTYENVNGDTVVYMVNSDGGYAITYIPMEAAVSRDVFDSYANSFVSGMLEASEPSEQISIEDIEVGAFDAKEFLLSITVPEDMQYYMKGTIINYSEYGYLLCIAMGYAPSATYLLDYYDYSIQYMQTFDPSAESQDILSDAASESNSDPSVRDVLDQYEAFMNEYIAFMQTYYNATPDQMLDMLDDYYDLLEEYDEMVELLDSLDTSSMTAEDYAYYIEVTNRVNENLMSIYGLIGG